MTQKCRTVENDNYAIKPWQVIHGNFCGPFPSGDYLLVLMDEHSRFPEVEIIRKSKSPEVEITLYFSDY